MVLVYNNDKFPVFREPEKGIAKCTAYARMQNFEYPIHISPSTLIFTPA